MGITQDSLDKMCPSAGRCSLGTYLTSLENLANANKAAIGVLVTLANELKTDLSAHDHGAEVTDAATIAAADSAAVSVADVAALTTFD